MLKDWNCTCGACPTQYEGHLTTGEYIYFRYRWGHASLEISEAEADWWENEYLFRKSKSIGHPLDGTMSEDEVQALIDPWLELYIEKRTQKANDED